ncbi:MAG: efflux transporter outer membrane subunit [Phenylobacterium sp.]|uniref:efflux transporter outer membrane subunit n=1 Tax=Phenylobacterium sp. TaxID=1871053 RepID=UPI0025D41547|nr:efflux transporter outer membrane subunit [Phenylobacterium sp.]MBI1198756.1 efflux transporter outer membrane subunit [Phenylobacterium sp.]
MPLRTRSLRLTGAALAALSLAACATVGPDFQAPAGPTGPAADRYVMNGDSMPANAHLAPESRAAGPWWGAFGPETLDQTIRLALADSPTIAEARATLERARAQAAAARGAELPQVDATAGAQRERINTQSFGFTGFPSPTINLYEVGASVSYDLDLFGGRRRATERAEARAEQAAREADAAYLTLSANIAAQAVRIAGLRAQIDAQRSVINEDNAIADIVAKAQEAGGEAPSATTGVRAQLAEDEALLPPLQRQLAQARHQLALLVGKSPAEWTAPDFALTEFRVRGEVPFSLPSQLVRRRPDILAAEAELHAATAAIGVAVADQYPDLRLTAGLTQGSIQPENLFNYSATGWSLLAGATAPVFHGGALKAQRAAAEAEARASLARYQQTVLRAFVQVSDVLVALRSDGDQIAAAQRARAAAEARYKDAEVAYRLGGGALMQLIDAQRQLGRARRGFAEAEAQRYADLVELYAATAADWRAEQ